MASPPKAKKGATGDSVAETSGTESCTCGARNNRGGFAVCLEKKVASSTQWQVEICEGSRRSKLCHRGRASMGEGVEPKGHGVRGWILSHRRCKQTTSLGGHTPRAWGAFPASPAADGAVPRLLPWVGAGDPLARTHSAAGPSQLTTTAEAKQHSSRPEFSAPQWKTQFWCN